MNRRRTAPGPGLRRASRGALLPALIVLSLVADSVSSRPVECTLGDCQNGRGRLVLENRFEYAGEFRAGLFSGEGELRFADGGRYRGAFQNDRFEGLGLLEFANGARYAGEFARGRFSGAGTYVFASGSRYEGEFADGRMHGAGRFEGGDGSLYEGGFRSGRKHGRGVSICRTACGAKGASFWIVLRAPQGDAARAGASNRERRPTRRDRESGSRRPRFRFRGQPREATRRPIEFAARVAHRRFLYTACDYEYHIFFDHDLRKPDGPAAE